MPVLNYTTTVAASKTVGEIQTKLTAAGATRIMIENDDRKGPAALVFEVRGYSYRLPCRSEAVYRALKRDRAVPTRFTTPEQALRVAWRIVKDWVEAQIAIIETGMVEVKEVFLPYQVMSTGQTMCEHYHARQLARKA